MPRWLGRCTDLLRAERCGVRIPGESREFSLLDARPDQPTVQRVLGLERPERGTEHSPHTSARLSLQRARPTPLLPLCLRGMLWGVLRVLPSQITDPFLDVL